MIDLLFLVLVTVYGLVLAALFFYGLNFFYLMIQAVRFNRPDPSPPPMAAPVRVTVQVPVYNERFVVERVIDAVANMRWPGDYYEIQILDDSTDDTPDIVARSVASWRARGLTIEHIRRIERTGFKAGALENGIRHASGDFLAVFDADFIPPSDFLEKAVPHLVADDGLAFVQTRWEHLNADDSSLTKLQALALDAHFGVEQFARSRSGHMFNFNGTAGVWRRSAVEAVGGWRARTLTEDLDLSYRVLLAGWRGLYLRDLVAPAELPPTISAFRRQQMRWAQGSIECAIYLVPQILHTKMSVRHKIQGMFHLSGYMLHILLFLLGLLYPMIGFAASKRPQIVSLYGAGALFGLTIFAPTLFFLYGQIVLGRKWWRDLPGVLSVSLLGVGMTLNTMRAFRRALGRGERVFERTPKWGQAEPSKRVYHLGRDGTVWLELGWAVFNIGAALYALALGQLAISFFSAMFGIGTLYVGVLMLMEQRRLSQDLPRRLV